MLFVLVIVIKLFANFPYSVRTFIGKLIDELLVNKDLMRRQLTIARIKPEE